MSLSVAAHGILKTHLTWDEVEHELQKAFNTNAHFGPNKSATSVGDLKGFMSKIALIDPDWQNKKSDEKLPEKFIVKICSQLPLLEMRDHMKVGSEEEFEQKIHEFSGIVKMFHNREVESYRLIDKYGKGKIATTKIYASRKFDETNQLKGFIISEYFPDIQHIPTHDSISYEDMRPIVKAVAEFSALGEYMLENELEFAKTSSMASVVENFLDDKSVDNFNSLFKEKMPAEHEPKIDEYISIIKEFYTSSQFLKNFEKMHEIINHKPVLIHCDLWASNLLCAKTKENHVELKAIIDFQTVSVGSPGMDVGRLFTSSLTTKDRRDHLDDLLHLYYETFVSKLEGKKPPYTFEQLKSSYFLAFPILAFLVIPTMGTFLDQTNIAEDLRQKINELAIEKMIGLLDDAIEIHKKNFAEFPIFYQ
ncbi:unnamed protein product [Caenorhabditis bovis]|uniref:CHK kinase-like domain-containing protein n=1 Tax=Caenorhabditis bovis TaxID=2654633 RepID=A0A8S1DZX3_9PELO|nr:unnamed protein product [Caenorhabditis bovis]